MPRTSSYLRVGACVLGGWGMGEGGRGRDTPDADDLVVYKGECVRVRVWGEAVKVTGSQ